MSTLPINKRLGLGQIQVLQGPQNTNTDHGRSCEEKHHQKTAKHMSDFPCCIWYVAIQRRCFHTPLAAISNAASLSRGKMQGADLVQGTGLWQGHLLLL